MKRAISGRRTVKQLLLTPFRNRLLSWRPLRDLYRRAYPFTYEGVSRPPRISVSLTNRLIEFPTRLRAGYFRPIIKSGTNIRQGCVQRSFGIAYRSRSATWQWTRETCCARAQGNSRIYFYYYICGLDQVQHPIRERIGKNCLGKIFILSWNLILKLLGGGRERGNFKFRSIVSYLETS